MIKINVYMRSLLIKIKYLKIWKIKLKLKMLKYIIKKIRD